MVLLWRALLRVTGGGFYEVGRLSGVVHDRGMYAAVDRIVRWEWRRDDRT